MIVPILNEIEVLPELYTRVVTACEAFTWELILVDDGSTDGSRALIEDLSVKDERVRPIFFTRNFGHQRALLAGYSTAIGDLIISMDGDLQDPPELIPDLLSKLSPSVHVVYAQRRSRKGESWFKRSTAKMFYRIFRSVAKFDIPLDTGDYRVIDRTVYNALKRMPVQEPFLRGQIAWLGFKSDTVQFDRPERITGNTNFSTRKMLRFAMDGFTMFSTTPLRFATYAGLFVSSIAFIIILYALYSKYILNDVIAGWSSLIISTMFLGGVQLLAIGLIGEYIGRIRSDASKWPLYIVDEQKGKERVEEDKKEYSD